MFKVMLLVDDSEVGKEIVALLEECEIPFEIMPVPVEGKPCIRYNDELYEGLPDIALLIDGLGCLRGLASEGRPGK